MTAAGAPKLVIVGGGYLGSDLAKSLDAVMDVTLIERASHFTHAPAMIRAMVDPALLDRALIPYDGLLSRGRVIRGEAASVDGGGVTLTDGTRIAGDYIVLATGSANAAPFKSATGDIEGLRADAARWNAALRGASRVLIIGAGAVGTELAGEIAHAHPDKTVTLVASDPALFPGFPAKLGASLAAKLQAMGVKVITGARAASLPGRDQPEGGTVTLSNGAAIEADLIVPAVGSRPLTSVADTLPDVGRAADGRVAVDGYLRPSSLPNVFAAGDIAAAGDAMTIVAISRQKPWLEKTLKSLAGGKRIEGLKPYAPWGEKAPILVPLGPRRGSSYLMVATLGDWVTRMMKGRDLFLTKYNKLLGRA
ncbi:NAD(P)/FAD-dependent oxidoreductase [Poseidonocella sedimentorum]|uniref:NADH dehydrogenase, FAD-containing subunit n=1 Tax=Poseidonocella sedimentorum TaxID=871652 RepID=A0A1I6CUY8_9RHOB|nr:FAD-dependent oxidoreductase [Poseidonocella sedimentorum]SFQ96962.1 NADH dehydrogenase, FAD-containing subunit [Poseidonocella sedimentorum]